MNVLRTKITNSSTFFYVFSIQKICADTNIVIIHKIIRTYPNISFSKLLLSKAKSVEVLSNLKPLKFGLQRSKSSFKPNASLWLFCNGNIV
jgi:hypothetical protein